MGGGAPREAGRPGRLTPAALAAVCDDPARPLPERLAAARELGDRGDVRLARPPVPCGAFRAARFPVTNGEYARFLEESATPPPRFWRDPAWPHVNGPNQPVTGVTRDEASAFAAWAGGRLPTEPEWELLAGAPRAYPWGHAWQDGACCFRGVLELRAPPPVGVFPAGASPCGALDCAGTVWEWCDGDEGGLAPVRGGAWNSLREGVGVAARNLYKPGDRWSNIGFRVVYDQLRF